MPRKNHRHRRPQAPRVVGPKPRRGLPPPPPLEAMVVPEGKCYFRSRWGKLIFTTEEKALRALEQAKAHRARRGSGHVEERIYPCPTGGCGGFHLTSRTEWKERGAS